MLDMTNYEMALVLALYSNDLKRIMCDEAEKKFQALCKEFNLSFDTLKFRSLCNQLANHEILMFETENDSNSINKKRKKTSWIQLKPLAKFVLVVQNDFYVKNRQNIALRKKIDSLIQADNKIN